MAPLTESQLAGFRVGTGAEKRTRPRPGTNDPQQGTEQRALALDKVTPDAHSSAEPVPTRSDAPGTARQDRYHPAVGAC